MRHPTLPPLLALFGLLALAALPSAARARERHLLLDSTLVASSRNLTTELGTPEKSPDNPLFPEEYPWEPRFDNLYPNVVWDSAAGLYKCWYTPFVVSQLDPQRTSPAHAVWTHREPGLCYATSTDGLHWKKPLLPAFPFAGRPSNVVQPHAGDCGVLDDAHETDPARRYKLLYRPDRNGVLDGLASAVSPDGLHWSGPTDLHFSLHADTHNNAIWAPTLGRYVLLTRDWSPDPGAGPKGVRVVSRSESPDFIHWSAPQVVFRGEDARHQIYSMPIFFYGGVYLGLLTIFEPAPDRTHVELAWSKDTVSWHRVAPGQALIGNAAAAGGYDWGCVYASVPVFETSEIRIYYGASDGPHTGLRKGYFALATLRPDGFAAVTAADPAATAELTTIPLDAGQSLALALTGSVADGGTLTAVVLDADTDAELGRVTLTGTHRLTSTVLPLSLAHPAARCRLRFELRQAKLYSFEL